MTTQNEDAAGATHILLVDDDPDVRDSVTKGLRKLGLHVRSVGTAEEALEAAADPDLPIDVIVMDIVLPDAWGSQVVMEQHRLRPESKVIYISGYSEEDSLIRATAVGDSVDFLAKPFTVEELADRISKVLDDHGEEEE